jgi:hypothetical protein
LKERSFGKWTPLVGVSPKTALNQTLEKPTIPKKFAEKIIIKVDNGANSSRPENIYSSLINFIVPGNPENKIQPKSIATPKFGVMWSIPFISTMLRVL